MNISKIRWAVPVLIVAAQFMMLKVGMTTLAVINIWLLIALLVLAKLEKQVWEIRKDLTALRLREEIK